MKVLMSLASIFLFCLAGQALALWLPVPGSVLAMGLMLLFLWRGWVKRERVAPAGDFFLHNLAFFFLPSGVAIMEKYDLVRGKILLLALICVVTAFLVYGATATTVRLAMRWQGKWQARHE